MRNNNKETHEKLPESKSWHLMFSSLKPGSDKVDELNNGLSSSSLLVTLLLEMQP